MTLLGLGEPPTYLEVIYRVLTVQDKKLTTISEFKDLLIIHVFAASYSTSVVFMTAKNTETFFFQIGITGKRYSDVWSAMSFTVERRQRIDIRRQGWSNFPQRANYLITEVKNDLVSISSMFCDITGQKLSVWMMIIRACGHGTLPF